MQVESIANSGAKIIVLFALSVPTAKVLSEAEYEACFLLPPCSSLTSVFFSVVCTTLILCFLFCFFNLFF